MLSALTLMVPLLLASGGGRCYLVTNTTIRVLPSCDFSPSSVDALTERSALQTDSAPAPQTGSVPAPQTGGVPAWREAAPLPSRNGRLTPAGEAAPHWQRGARGRRITGTGP